jgi:dipeptide/tripeptide permease
MRELITALRALRHSPAALWYVIAAYAIDAAAYFGVLTLMTEYLTQDLGLTDAWASRVVSFFTMAVTLFMIGVGGAAERRGVRKGVLLALALALVGRVGYAAAGGAGAARIPVVLVGLLIVALGEGILQPVAYAGIKQYTDEKTSSMGYALMYAAMNLAIVVIGAISPPVREHWDDAVKAGTSATSGVAAVGWTCVGISLLTFVVVLFFFDRRREAQTIRPVKHEADAKQSIGSRIHAYFVGTEAAPSPFRDARFVFFIFMLLPVRTLFAHQWLTMPNYVLRAYDPAVAAKMEWIVNWVNPLIVFFGVPTITALTKKKDVYTMMIVGTAVSALPTFLLCLGPHLPILLLYLVVFSIGEALWSARFLEYASELAPEGRVAQYMGLANVPWILAKGTTGLYSGWMMERYCPKVGPKDTATMWLIYGLIAVTSPIGLVLAHRWVKAAPAPKHA